MSLIEKIDRDLKEALKAGKKEKLTTLRGLKSDIKYKQIEKGKELSDEEIMEVLSSAAKRRRDSIEQYGSAGRDDLVRAETAELELIEEYLPEQLSEEQLKDLIRESIENTGADSPAKMGLVMKDLMPKVKGKADGKLVNSLVKQYLTGDIK